MLWSYVKKKILDRGTVKEVYYRFVDISDNNKT